MAWDLKQARKLHQEGRLGDAERLYRLVLQQQPRDFEALHLLGALKLQQDRPEEAIGLIRGSARCQSAPPPRMRTMGWRGRL